MRPVRGHALAVAPVLGHERGAGKFALEQPPACPPPPPIKDPDGAVNQGNSTEEGGGMAIQLRGLATTVEDLWAADVAAEPRAPGLRKWASSIMACIYALKRLGRTALTNASGSRAHLAGGHLTERAARGDPPAALHGIMSTVQLAQKLQLVHPTVVALHWAVAAGAGRAYN